MTSLFTVSSMVSPISLNPAKRAYFLYSRPAYLDIRILLPSVTAMMTAGDIFGYSIKWHSGQNIIRSLASFTIGLAHLPQYLLLVYHLCSCHPVTPAKFRYFGPPSRRVWVSSISYPLIVLKSISGSSSEMPSGFPR